MTEKLEPCPCQFCGGRTEVVKDPRPQWLTWYVVICAEGDPCGAMGPARRTRDEAVIAYNTRPTPAAPEDNICLKGQCGPDELFAGLAEDGLMESIGYAEDMPVADREPTTSTVDDRGPAVRDAQAYVIEAMARAIKGVWDAQMIAEANASKGVMEYEPGPWEEWIPEARAAYAAAEEAWTRQVVDAWQRVADALDDIPGGMHAELEDAASAFAEAIDARQHIKERKG